MLGIQMMKSPDPKRVESLTTSYLTKVLQAEAGKWVPIPMPRRGMLGRREAFSRMLSMLKMSGISYEIKPNTTYIIRTTQNEQ
jgi:hypothetical protein